MPRTRREQREDSSAPSTPSTDASTQPLPPPLTTRNLRPRAYVTRSRASSISRSHSAADTTTGDETSVHRPPKRRRLALEAEVVEHTTAGNSYLDTTPRPDWRNMDGYDDEEGLDQLDQSDIEEPRAAQRLLERTSSLGPSTSSGAGVRPSTSAAAPRLPNLQLPSTTPTPPPLTITSITNLSSHDDVVEIIQGPSTRPSIITTGLGASSSSSSKHRSGPRHWTQAPRETIASPVSSPSLMKIINETNIEPGAGGSSNQTRLSDSPDVEIVEAPVLPTRDKGKGKAKAPPSPTPPPVSSSAPPRGDHRKESGAEPLSEYTCPICFFPPSNATLTPCGHVCCGSCLFTAVKTTLQRGMNMGMAVGVGENVARCPVCRAVIPGWDGKGKGVIGLKVRQVINL